MKMPTFRRAPFWRLLAGLSLVAVFVLHGAGVMRLDFLQRLEQYAYDTRLRMTLPGGVDQRVVIVDIDEASLLTLGRWPWPRNQLAHLVNVLFDQYQIDVLGFDILFAERDTSSGLAVMEQLGQTTLKDDAAFARALADVRPQLLYDQQFADSLKGRRVVMGYYFRHDQAPTAPVGQLPAAALAPGSFEPSGVGAVVANGYTANLPELQGAAEAGGFFNASPLVDADGAYRRVSLLQAYGGALYESLGLAVARLALREPAVALVHEQDDVSAPEALESLRVGDRRVPLDAEVAALVPFRGRQGSFVYVSAQDVLSAKVAPSVLQGAIVLLGTTAPGLLDLRATPVQESYPGVEMHANVIAGILDGTIKESPPYTQGFELLVLLVAGLGLALGLPKMSPGRGTLLFVGVSAALLAGNLWAWQNQLILPLAASLVLVTALYAFNMGWGYFVDARSKRLLARLFGQYVPEELVTEMARDPGVYTLQSTNREMTVLFSDVRGFTSISEGLDPQQLATLMNAFLTPMTRVIHQHRGTIDKYMGDAIMAFWGAPVADPQHARHALQAAMLMVAELKALDADFKARGWPPIRIGVGLNTGDMTVGNMGSEFRLAYTVMGDAVNLGSRLESLTKEYGVQIMVSEFTAAAVPEFAFLELDRVRVKGKDRPVTIYEPLGLLADLSALQRSQLQAHAQALALYRSQQWAAAAQAFADLQTLEPQRALYRIYAARVAHFTLEPPAPDWDGAHTFLTK